MPNTIPHQQIPETERNSKIVKLYSSGSYTYRSIARIFKISTERVHQIVKREKKGGEQKKTD